jgi:hypothetical protein
MIRSSMQSETVCAPIVSLSSLVSPWNDQEEILLWSIGGIFFWDLNNTQHSGDRAEKSLILFDYCNIHGFSLHNDAVVAFGDKSVAILKYGGQNFELLSRKQALDDVVVDCKLITSALNVLTLVIGYAHNFYDIIQVRCEINEWILQKRYQCQETVTLFTLAFFIDTSNISDNLPSTESVNVNNIIVASGDLFGKLTLWKGNEEDKEEKKRQQS